MRLNSVISLGFLVAVSQSAPILNSRTPFVNGKTYYVKDGFTSVVTPITTLSDDGEHIYLVASRNQYTAPIQDTIPTESILPVFQDRADSSALTARSISISAAEADLPIPNNLPKQKQYITTHNSQGKAIFSSAVPEDISTNMPADEMQYTSLYVTSSFPVDLTAEADLAINSKFRTSPPTLVNEEGSVLRLVDFAPGSPAIMHRTVSLDYAIVMEGEVELVLNGGERKVMKRGDVAVQRGTMHAWKNTDMQKWARVLFVLQPSVPLEFGGKKYGEAVGGLVN